MKFFITYFYNVRFLSPNSIAVSTAVWDPKWFHNFNGDSIFIDKRGLYNGYRIPELSPSKIEHVDCGDTCNKDFNSCRFLKEYRDYIYSLDFNYIKNKLLGLAESLKYERNLRATPNIYLLVHEKPDNPCSERGVLVSWFKDNNISLEEFKK